jgi:hypothetical protein
MSYEEKSVDKCWVPTCYQRWEERILPEFVITKKVLMTKWINTTNGQEEWREVPEVTEG